MLVHTFIHLPGIGPSKERSLWKAGIRTWADLRRRFEESPRLPLAHRDDPHEQILKCLANSVAALNRGDVEYFADTLPKSEHYRIALSFPDQTAFVDIETTGLSHFYDQITVVGASIGQEYICHLGFQSEGDIFEFIQNAKCLVTFNGSVFDCRFLEKAYPALRLPPAHVDLRFLAARAGYSGGQKAVEQSIGRQRDASISNMNGEAAPILWHRYKLGEIDAAKTLIKYNHADIEGMKLIFDHVVERIAPDGRTLSARPWSKFSEHRSMIRWDDTGGSTQASTVIIPPFERRSEAFFCMDMLTQISGDSPLTVVGIDLTGSDRRPTGWCVMTSAAAETCRLSTDDDIIRATVEAKPNVISIDSPLSLPRGRTQVGDDDPMRAEAGIMRGCERELKRRGVNVYPSLIPSMQKLTARGIRLATEFRSRGLAVIESYPGAAQDIMGIPRKRAGLDYLKRGLVDFGVDGPFVNTVVTHDELDAITAAIVGFFFWSGRFEPLGNDDEDYLIIPDLKRSPERWSTRRVVGISGEIASGKTSSARWLENNGFTYGRFGQILESMLQQEGEAISREALQSRGAAVHRDPGQRWLAKQLLNQMPRGADLVIDGLRWRIDHAFLKERFGPAFLHVHLASPELLRRERYVAAGGSVLEFECASDHAVETEAAGLADHADVVITNTGTISDLYNSVGGALTDRFGNKAMERVCL